MRTPGRLLVAGALLVASAGLAGADLSGGRLVVRGLGRGPGRQAATLVARLTPAPAAREAVAVTLQIGGRPFALAGQVGRKGLLLARGTGLDLTSVAAELDATAVVLGIGVAGDVPTLTFAACRSRRRGTVVECRVTGGSPEQPPCGSTGPDGAPPAGCPGDPPNGVYDVVELDAGPPGTPTALAELTVETSGRRLRVKRNLYDSLEATVTGDPHGGWLLDGYTVLGGDALVQTTGTARPVREASGWRIEVTAGADLADTSWSIVLRRPDGGTPAALGGAWTMQLDMLGQMSLALHVQTNGLGSADATTVTGAGGEVRYTVGPGDCRVAPSGPFSCWFSEVEPSPFGLQMFGTLAPAPAGTFVLGGFPLIDVLAEFTGARP